MAGAKVPAPLDPMVNGDDWTNILARYNRTEKGSEGVSLTNWVAGNTDRPEIAAGSVIEIDGAPFEYATDETIVDGAGLTDGWCYIKHVVSGDAVTPTLTNTFGTWDTAKQGFYDGGDRYSLHKMYRSGAVTKIFTLKQIIQLNNEYNDVDDTILAVSGEKIKTIIYSGTVTTESGWNVLEVSSSIPAANIVSIDCVVYGYNILYSWGFDQAEGCEFGYYKIDPTSKLTARRYKVSLDFAGLTGKIIVGYI